MSTWPVSMDSFVPLHKFIIDDEKQVHNRKDSFYFSPAIHALSECQSGLCAHSHG